MVDNESREQIIRAISNAHLLRGELLRELVGTTKKDLNYECDYPTEILPSNYRAMYDREGVAARVVDVWPQESWSVLPSVYETEDPEQETEFEREWHRIVSEKNIFYHLLRIDQLSGIGRYGILLIGLDDGQPLDAPVETPSSRRDLLYLRPFDESVLDIVEVNKDPTSPRFGYPEYYSITFESDSTESYSRRVHWSRVVHVADGRQMSEVYGTPRMKSVYNRLLDVRKILGGSAEMFWRGAFPGLSFEIDGDTDTELDTDSLKDTIESYVQGLSRYLALQGTSVKSLAPQVASPSNHLDVQLQSIAISLAIPKRILFGSEQAELASSQDSKTWNRRVMQRQNGYLSQMIIRPFIDRLIALGVLPEPTEYMIDWPDLNSMSDMERAEVGDKWAQALSKYVAGDIVQMVPASQFLSIFCGMDVEDINQIREAMEEQAAEEEVNESEVEEQEEAEGADAEQS